MIKDKVIECLRNIGIYVEDDEENFELDDYIAESFLFVSFLLEIEEMFGIEIPEEYLIIGSLRTLEDICNMIEVVTNKE